MNFDRLAPFYRAMEALSAGRKLQRCRLAFIDEIPPPRRILLLGEGHGRFLPACQRKFPDAEITVLDSSRRMLAIAKSKSTPGRIRFVHADVLDWQAPTAEFDLIVTHFFLDCLTAEELSSVVGKIRLAATGSADWLLADFEMAPTGIARLRSWAILTILYRFFQITCGLRAGALIPPDATLAKAGFRKIDRRIYDWGLLKSEWWRHVPGS